MSAIRSNGALWHSGEHRVPAPATAPRGEPGRFAAAETVAIYRELGRWKARATELERQLAAAESQALSSQITPHFLCNSLQAVSTLLQRDPAAADSMVLALSELLRIAVRGAAMPEVPLSREVALIERYVAVMRFRFGNDLRLSLAVAPETRDALIPHLLLQPLVENAVLHGLGDDGGEIRVGVELHGDTVHCTVADNGRGLPPGPVVEGIGLGATRGRLRAMYGERYRLELGTNETGGVTVMVALPYTPGDTHAEGGR